MKEIKTLEDALALVPTHWPLVPDVDKWKEGDKALSKSGQWGDGVRRLDAEIYLAFRRPIPKSVREAEAYRYLMDGDLHPKYTIPIINAISIEGIKLARKHKHPLLAWVQENRK